MERRKLWNCAQRKWNTAGSGTREALMELRAAPYPYSKMCELCELCELFVKKLLLKAECAILPDGALLIVMKKVTIISV